MNNEEKILAILEKHTEMFGQVFDRLEKHSEMFGQVFDRLEKHSEMFEQVFDRLDKMQAAQDKMQAAQTQMQDDITGIKARLDYDVDARLKAMNENIDTILEKLTPKSRIDALEDEMVFMKSVIKAMSQRIADLEKAQ